MPEGQELHIKLDDRGAELVRHAMASGHYANEAAVVTEALESWQDQQGSAVNVELIRKLWQEGLDSGPCDMTIEDIKLEARQEFLRRHS